MKQYTCVEVKHHKDVAHTIEEYGNLGWCLHTYTTSGNQGAVSHYLLFERE